MKYFYQFAALLIGTSSLFVLLGVNMVAIILCGVTRSVKWRWANMRFKRIYSWTAVAADKIVARVDKVFITGNSHG